MTQETETVRELVRALYAELEELDAAHEDLTDTDVSEALHLTLNYFFVWGKSADRLPRNYRLFSRAGDEAVVWVPLAGRQVVGIRPSAGKSSGRRVPMTLSQQGLPRRPIGHPHLLDSAAFQEPWNAMAVDAVVVPEEVLRLFSNGRCLSELLAHPGHVRGFRHSEVPDNPSTVLPDEEDIEDTEVPGGGR